MNFYSQGRALQRLLGISVPLAAAALPANGVVTPYWTVAGGLVLITSLVGKVTTIFQANATTLLFRATPTVGTAVNMCAASASLSAKEVGGLLSVDGAAITTAMQSTNAGNIGLMSKPIVVNIGTIDLLSEAAENTGAVRWLLTYIPLEEGATVVAA